MTAPPLCLLAQGRTANLLLSDGAVPVNPATLKKAVTNHAVAEHKKEYHQQDYEQEVSSSERGRLWSCRVRRIRWTGHGLNFNHRSQSWRGSDRQTGV